MTADWKLTFPCTRAEAEAIGDDFEAFAMLEPAPSIAAREIEAFNDSKWELIAYFSKKPPKAVILQIQAMIASAKGAEYQLEKLPETDWVVESQQGLQPVTAGRFYIHTSLNKDTVPQGSIAIQIEASQAFGTGGHETTSGCLATLDYLKKRGQNFKNIIDVGTGTGLLAFAALHLWPRAYCTASDIDPISIDVTAENAKINSMPLGRTLGRIALCIAVGTDHAMIQQRANYDLVIANILAGPLIELAPAFAEIIAEGGTLILAGLLNTQADIVTKAYQRKGFRLQKRSDNGDWPCLCLVKRRHYGWRRGIRAKSDSSQPPGDFGTW